MKVEVTEAAAGVLSRSLEMAGLDARSAGIRVRQGPGLGGGRALHVELADGPELHELVVESAEIRLFVDRELEGALADAVVTVEPPHDHVVVRPRSAPTDDSP